MVPPLIYGFVPKHARLSIQIPTLTTFAIKHGFAGHMGDGLSATSNIHVEDLATAYVLLLHCLEKTPGSDQSLFNPYYFIESTGDNKPSWRDIAAAIGEGLHKAGRIEHPVPRTVPTALYGDLMGGATGDVLGLNTCSHSDRLRGLGWAPKEKDWRISLLKDELPEILKEDCSTFAGYGGTVSTTAK